MENLNTHEHNHIQENSSLKEIKMMLDEYHSKNAVEAVKLIYITKKEFPFEELNSLLTANENKTKALDHLVNKVKMDCHSCSLQVVCNEVEKMVNEDFKK